MAFDAEDWFVELALDSSPLDPAPVYIELPPRMVTLEVDRGRNFEQDRIDSGYCRIELDNWDGDFDPQNPLSPYYGRWDTGLKMRVGKRRNNRPNYLFTGFLEDLPITYPGMLHEIALLQAYDGLQRLNLDKQTIEFDEEEPSGARILRVLDAGRWPGTGLYSAAGHRDIDPGSSRIIAVQLEREGLRSHLDHIDVSERGVQFVARDGSYRFIERHALLQPPYSEVQFTFSDEEDSRFQYEDIQPELTPSRACNLVTGSRVGGQSLEVEDEVKRDKYGTRSLPLGELLLTTDNAVRDRLWYELETGKVPRTRYRSIACQPDSTEELEDAIWAHDIGTRVAVRKEHPRLHYVVTQEVRMEHFSHRLNFQQDTWNLQLQLALADPFKYWRYGVPEASTLGLNTRWAA